MAGPMDIKRETARIRRAQAERNRVAIAEAEQRRTEMAEYVAGTHRNRPLPGGRVTVEAHRRVYDALGGVAFTSKTAEQAARAADLTWQDFTGHEASGRNGYTTADVHGVQEARALAAEQEIQEEAASASGVKMLGDRHQDKMDRGHHEDKKRG